MRNLTVDFTNATRPKDAVVTWSEEQNAIFSWFERGAGNLVVRARAGTGKTTTILEGVNRAPEEKILLAAFNKSIAQELQRRIRNPRVEAKTLHGLGFAFLRRVWTGVRLEDRRADDLTRRAAPTAPDPIARLISRLHTKVREMSPFASVEDILGIATRFDLLPDDEWIPEGWTAKAVAQAARQAMEFAKEKTDIIDFADMIYLPIVLKMIRPWFNMVVVDEAQDMTEAQLLLATGACKRNGRIAVVGDDRQAIYSFRGADSGSIDRLKGELRAKELGLKTTYRCGSAIVNLAAKIVPDFRAAPSAPVGIISNLSEDAMLAKAVEGDFVLSRTNAPLIGFCLSLLKAGRRAKVKGRDIGKGIIALIRKQHANTVPALLTAIAAWTTRELENAKSLEEKKAQARSEFLADQQALIIALCEGCATQAEVIARAETLFSDDAEVGAIMLSTVHRAKGLEANRVFILDKTFFSKGLEEDNIRYVGITRAKCELTFVR